VKTYKIAADDPAVILTCQGCGEGFSVDALTRPEVVRCTHCGARHETEKPADAEPLTVVVFRRDREEPRDVLAVFPFDPGTADPGTCSFYVHVGQHGHGDHSAIIKQTRPANLADADVAALRRELEGIGYRLDVRTRVDRHQAYRRRLAEIVAQDRRAAARAAVTAEEGGRTHPFLVVDMNVTCQRCAFNGLSAFDRDGISRCPRCRAAHADREDERYAPEGRAAP